MPKGTSQKQNKKDDSGLNFEAQLGAAAIRCVSLSASMPFSAADGEKVAKPDEVSRESCEKAGARCRIQHDADSFRTDLHPDLKADFILATTTRDSAKTELAKPNRRSVGETELHPPFNMSNWGGENLRQDVRWKFGMPPVNNAN